jgi:hypothetical protein
VCGNTPREAALNNRSNTVPIIGVALLALAVILLAMLVFQNVQRKFSDANAAPLNVELDAEYHAVLLSNGLVYFGRVEKMDGRFVELNDVHYVQSGIEQKTKKPTNVLLKRGKEWHAPDRMVININHVVFIEPVDRDSKVAELIEALKRQ